MGERATVVARRRCGVETMTLLGRAAQFVCFAARVFARDPVHPTERISELYMHRERQDTVTAVSKKEQNRCWSEWDSNPRTRKRGRLKLHAVDHLAIAPSQLRSKFQCVYISLAWVRPWPSLGGRVSAQGASSSLLCLLCVELSLKAAQSRTCEHSGPVASGKLMPPDFTALSSLVLVCSPWLIAMCAASF